MPEKYPACLSCSNLQYKTFSIFSFVSDTEQNKEYDGMTGEFGGMK
jgi:hypothetical protein